MSAPAQIQTYITAPTPNLAQAILDAVQSFPPNYFYSLQDFINILTNFANDNREIFLQLSTTQPDFESIKQQLIVDLSTRDAWKDIITASGGGTVIDFVASIGAYGQAGIITALQETNLDTAVLTSSVLLIMRMLGVHILRKNPASVDVQLTSIFATKYGATYGNTLILPSLTQFILGSTSFYNPEIIIFEPGITEINTTLRQGAINSYSIISNGYPFQRFEIGNSDFAIADIEVYCFQPDGTEYKRITDGLYKYNTDSLVFYENCQSGDTLIPTENGIMRIDQIAGNSDKFKEKSINIKVGSLNKPRKAVKWFYQGIKQTYNVLTAQGNSLCCTGRHPNRVLDESTGELIWKNTLDSKIGDLLCVNPKQITRKKPLCLNIQPYAYKHFNSKTITIPNKMSPELAFCLGLIVSEGFVAKNSCIVSNTDTKLLDKFAKHVKTVFGIDTNRYTSKVKVGTLHSILGVETYSTKQAYTEQLHSKEIVDILKQLGVYYQNGLREGKKPSHFKQIPWSILQADKESQLAFIAAYLEGDGSINNKRGTVSWFSASQELIKQFGVLLNSHGYIPKIDRQREVSRLHLNRNDASSLWDGISKYMVSKHIAKINDYTSIAYGVPAKYWQELLKSRRIKCPPSYGMMFIDDNGKNVYLNLPKNMDQQYWRKAYRDKIYSYKVYKEGGLDILLEVIKKVSISGYKKLVVLLKLEYKFTPITKIEKGIKQAVYDISMEKGVEPAFIANGLCVHNTTPEGNIEILFGNDLYGAIPPVNNILGFVYVETQGAAANNSSVGANGNIVSFAAFVPDRIVFTNATDTKKFQSAVIDSISVQAVSGTYDGADQKDNDFYRAVGPYLGSGRKGMIRKAEHYAKALEFPGIADVLIRNQRDLDSYNRNYINCVFVTPLMANNQPMSNATWNKFVDYMSENQIWRVEWVLVQPNMIPLEIDATLYGATNSNLSAIDSYANSAIRQAYGIRRGSLGSSFYLSDCDSYLNLNFQNVKVDYIEYPDTMRNIIAEPIDYLYLDSSKINLAVEYSKRNYLTFSPPSPESYLPTS